jgi:polysaccharide export outer membrane protein
MTKSSVFSIALAFALASASPAVAEQDGQATVATAHAGQPLAATTPGIDATEPDARYRLRKGDVIELSFPFVPAFNQTIAVQPDGYVTLRGLRTIRVDGMTVPELSDTLHAEYASILRDPVLTIELKDFEKPYFVVAGEVERPGKYDLRGETTVTQAVAVAGGLRERAKESQVVVVRRLPGGNVETTPLDLKQVLKGGASNPDVRLRPGDLVFIPKGRRVDLGALTSSLWVLGLLP